MCVGGGEKHVLVSSFGGMRLFLSYPRLCLRLCRGLMAELAASELWQRFDGSGDPTSELWCSGGSGDPILELWCSDGSGNPTSELDEIYEGWERRARSPSTRLLIK